MLFRSYQEQVFDNQGTIHKASFDYKLQVLSSRIIEKRREEDCMIKRSRVDEPQAKTPHMCIYGGVDGNITSRTQVF